MTQTVNAAPKELSPERTAANILEQNSRRALKYTRSRATNLRYCAELQTFRNEVEIENDYVNDHLDRYGKAMACCCSDVLCAVETTSGNNYASVKTAHFCDHRFCNICNAVRSRLLRRKYFKFLNDVVPTVGLKETQHHFFPQWVNPLQVSGYNILTSLDFMHLTLTVPHVAGAWRGKGYYAGELIRLFNQMRKAAWWNELVFGGEYCIETTHGENGLHIHMHVMLMVKKVAQSRNKLYCKILKAWNKLTIDETNPVTSFTEKRIEAFNKLFKSFPQAWRDEYISQLDSRGSTMVGLSSLYYEVTAAQYAQRKKAKFTKNGKYYCYANGANVRSMVKGVTECLKYHFEPCVLEDEDGKLNVPLLCEMLPNIYRKRLYGKFGGLYKVKSLNIMDEPLTEEDIAMQGFDDIDAKEMVHHPFTGHPVECGELMYVVVDAKNLIFSDNGKHHRIANKHIKQIIFNPTGSMEGGTLKDAAASFQEIVTHRRKKNHAEGWFKWNSEQLN